MIDFSNSNPSIDRVNDLVIFTGYENGNAVRFTIGPIALGKLDPTADIKNAIDVYDRHRATIHEVAERVYAAERRTTLRKTDFDGGAGGMAID
jgi:hypothetical protein